MSSRFGVTPRAVHQGVTALLVFALVVSQVSVATAGNFNRNGAVGGISIDVDGVVRDAVVKDQDALAREMRKSIETPQGELARNVEIRKISLRALEAACQHFLTENAGQIPDELRYLGGLQRIQYVMVYPEQNDIVLAGPAEAWKVDDRGNVVGVTTGRPVLQLDDLLVALRSVHAARENITCSIDPSAEGYQRLNTVLSQQKRTSRVNVAALEAQMKEAFGPQQISLSGIAANTGVARKLVAADYRMKRLAMNLDEAPVAGLPSFVELIQNSRENPSNVNPRWWLACNYDPLVRSEDGLAWELRGPGVKVLTEDEQVDADGTVQGTGRSSAAAQKWADLMTEKYDALAQQDPVFGELRNVMDLCVIAALIEQHELMAKAGLSLPLLTGASSHLMVDTWNAPKTISPHCSFLKTRSGWIVTASGGVQIESWQVANRAQSSAKMREMRSELMAPAGANWWWN